MEQSQDVNFQQHLEILEKYCSDLYNSPNPSDRTKAEKQLEALLPSYAQSLQANGRIGDSLTTVRHPQEPLSTIQLANRILQTSSSSYAQLFACQRIKAIALTFFPIFDSDTKFEIRNLVLNILAARKDFQPFVVLTLAQLFAIITKIGWFDDTRFQNVNQDVAKFLELDIHYKTIGLQLLATLIEDLTQSSTPTLVRNAVKERKIVSDFKESQLLDTFTMAFEKLNLLLTSEEDLNFGEQSGKYVDALLRLLKSIVAFDFIGTNNDEAGEDNGSSQFPAAWKPIISQPEFIQSFFQCYHKFDTPQSTKALSCLVHIAATRRSLFYEDEGRSFALLMIGELTDLLESGQGLEDPDNHHELCRVLARFRSTHQLNNIGDTTEYWKWIKALSDFTAMTLNNWEGFPNSVPYLMTVWVKIVASSWNLSPTTGDDNMGTELHSIPSQIFSVFLTSRLAQVSSSVEGEGFYEDMLDNPDLLIESLEHIATIARYRYALSSDILLNAHSDAVQEYEAAMSEVGSQGVVTPALRIAEGRLAWIVYTVGALLAGRISYQSLDEDDLVDSNLSSKVFQLLAPNHAFLSQMSSRGVVTRQSTHLNFGFLYFFEQFQNNYIGDISYRTTLVYSRMSDLSNINDAPTVLEMMVQRIVLNLQTLWTDDNQLIARSIGLLNRLSSSYNAAKQLRNLDRVEQLLSHHGAHNFAFMLNPANLANRASLYGALAKLLYASDDLNGALAKFIKGFETSFQELASTNDKSQYLLDTFQFAISGMARDLQGFFGAAATRKSFVLPFNWFFPHHSSNLATACQIYAEAEFSDTGVNPLLALMKFYSELVMNRSQRLNFPVASADGLVLFRQISTVLCAVGQRIAQWLESGHGLTPNTRVKLLILWFRVAARVLGGGYVCFGAFRLYEDPALENLYQAYYRIIISLSLNDVHAYPKLRKSYYDLLELFVTDHMPDLSYMDRPVFLAINKALADGTQLVNDPGLSSSACRAIDSLISSLCHKRAQSDTVHYTQHLYVAHDELLPYLFDSLFSALLFGTVSNVWAYSRPLLAFLTYDRRLFVEFSTKLLARQLEACRPRLEQSLGSLLDGVDVTLEPSNRDLFTQRLTSLFRDLHSNDVALIPLPTEPLIVFSSMSLV